MSDNMQQDILNSNEGITIRELVSTISKYRYFVIIAVSLSLLLSGIYLYFTKPVYRASGKMLINTTGNSVLTEDKIFSLRDNYFINNSYVVRIKGRSISDSVIIKTNAFVTANIPPGNEQVVQYVAVSPPREHTKYIFTPTPNSRDSADYKVFTGNGLFVGAGRFHEEFVTDNVSLRLNNLWPLKNDLEIELLPLNTAREKILSNLVVSNIRDTNIIQISYKSTQPLQAMNIVNTYMMEFSQKHLADKREEFKAKIDFLEKQFNKLSQQLEHVEINYRDFKVSTGVVSLTDQTKQYIDLLRYLEEKRIDFEINLQEAISAKEKSNEILSGDPELQNNYKEYASSPFISDNVVLQELYSKIAELQVENARLTAEYNTSHPQVLQNLAELESARSQLDKAMIETINNATKGVDPILRPVVEKQLVNTININVYDRLLDQIQNEIENLNTTIESLPEAEIDQAQFERNMRINEELYHLLLTRLEEARIMEASTISDLKVIDWAELPLKPVSPSITMTILFSIFGSLFFSGLIIFTKELFNTSFPSIDSIEQTLGVRVIAQLPKFKSKRKGEREIYVGFAKHDGNEKHQAFEFFNRLRINLFASDDFIQRQPLIISSALPMEGKSFICANLSAALSHIGKKVLLIDCDFRNPVLNTIIKAQNSKGIVDILKDQSIKGITKTNHPNLFFLPAGNTQDIVISELISNQDLYDTIDRLQHLFDIVIIDTPPITLYTDAIVLASYFKMVMLVMKYNTKREAVIYTKKLINTINANILGIVVNGIEKPYVNDYSYGYNLGYKYQYKT